MSVLERPIGFVLQTGKTNSRCHQLRPLDLVSEKYNLYKYLVKYTH
jgi:hypothetical protein